MATIKDVAKAAGVSVSAVSKYLRTPENMREETRNGIAAAVEALGYKPNPLARGLRTGKSGIVAVMIPEITNPYFNSIFDLLQSGCNEMGLIPVLLRNNSLDDLDRAVNLLKSGFISGVFFYDDSPAEAAICAAELKIPVVHWSPAIEKTAPNTVYIDLQHGFRLLCQHLEQVGVRDAVYIGHANNVSAAQKYAAVASYCREEGHRLRLVDDVRLADIYNYKYGFDACGEMLQRLSSLPQAIICEADIVAMGALKQLAHHGLEVPEDTLLSGCDNTHLSVMSNPSITSVEFPLKAMCSKALEMLSALMQGQECQPVTFQTSLVVRTSTTPVSGGQRP